VKGNGVLELIIPVFGGAADSRVMEGMGRAADISCNIDLKQVREVLVEAVPVQFHSSDIVFGGISYG
jgi:hypothetical protein